MRPGAGSAGGGGGEPAVTAECAPRSGARDLYAPLPHSRPVPLDELAAAKASGGSLVAPLHLQILGTHDGRSSSLI